MTFKTILKPLAATLLTLAGSSVFANQLTLDNTSSAFATFASFDASGNHLSSGNCGGYKTCTFDVPNTAESIQLTLNTDGWFGIDSFKQTLHLTTAFANAKIICSPFYSCSTNTK